MPAGLGVQGKRPTNSDARNAASVVHRVGVEFIAKKIGGAANNNDFFEWDPSPEVAEAVATVLRWAVPHIINGGANDI